MGQLYLTALGSAVPENSLSSVLGDGNSGTVNGASFSAKERRTVLSSPYISETGNREPYESMQGFLTTPTELGAQAAKQALEAAGVAAEDLDLISGATSTPLQTIPTESQRIGKELGVKLPSYDIYCGGADLALQLETVLSWKQERMPNRLLLISTQAPTTRLHFSEGEERYFFGDGAGAALFTIEKDSSQKEQYRIEKAAAIIHPKRSKEFTIDLYGHLRCDFSVEELFLKELQELYQSSKDLLSEDTTFIESQLTPSSHEKLKGAVGGEKWVSHTEVYGNTLGAAPLISLAGGGIDSEHVVLFLSGIGLSTGIVVLKREG